MPGGLTDLLTFGHSGTQPWVPEWQIVTTCSLHWFSSASSSFITAVCIGRRLCIWLW